ncbi:phosphoribosyltransferase [Paraburkholderia sp. DHOC27]|uniref:phosphoribosyltransferase n=1 Tax=Paraburkholderia sp. DHOC27 TaxID=2303330 RepID=UPI000E3B68DF|nr:phosphoribosyltransferase family protein [Paraburkholderia sp. DHOC27]RFU47698.1 phosphoribosyltransferase [Paraburkholderia sp. DHOC27]
MDRIFANRTEAGRALARHLRAYAKRPDVVVLALPPGGVPVAWEVAAALEAPLDLLMVRKLGVPWQEELAMGALASGGALYVDHALMREAAVGEPEFAQALAAARLELARREILYRAARPAVDVTARVAIVVDDGMATGATLLAAVRALRGHAPAKIVAALPVAPHDARARLGDAIDEFVCVMTPRVFFSVGQFYDDFAETTDDDVRALLASAFRPPQP